MDELRLHVASSSVCYTASSALHSALDGHEANSARFVECGGLALFEDIVTEHDDEKINSTVEKMMSALVRPTKLSLCRDISRLRVLLELCVLVALQLLSDPRHRALAWSTFDPIESRPHDWEKLGMPRPSNPRASNGRRAVLPPPTIAQVAVGGLPALGLAASKWLGIGGPKRPKGAVCDSSVFFMRYDAPPLDAARPYAIPRCLRCAVHQHAMHWIALVDNDV
eukprot:SAG11_NODE_114_length_16040_cov_10.050875_12_plen_224_part_00